MSFEEEAYEIPEIWDPSCFGEDERARVAVFGAKVPSDAKTLLDVGCGNGLFLNYLAANTNQRFQRLCGVDRSEAALHHVNVEKHTGSADKLPFADREFDVVTSLEVIEHLPLGIYEKALAEIVRVSRRYVVIGVPCEEDLRCGLTTCPLCRCRFNANYHLRSFDRATVMNLLDRHDAACKEVFFAGPIRRLPKQIARVVEEARLLRNGGTTTFPGYAVCPACGHRDTTTLRNAQPAKPKGGVYGLIRDAFLRDAFRWIGGVFERR